ncbi:MAG: hypothetical protein ABJP02_15725 [Parasphingorhabdus sp.]|uniref:hypothetical protein n=1 Tax=Parasphingorhabdus sp. TaxID=2709688 RepID=UPI00329A38B6
MNIDLPDGIVRAAPADWRRLADITAEALVLNTCDAKDIPCYLENSNPENHGFYAHHGFERREIFACGEGGPSLEAMWREPR